MKSVFVISLIALLSPSITSMAQCPNNLQATATLSAAASDSPLVTITINDPAHQAGSSIELNYRVSNTSTSDASAFDNAIYTREGTYYDTSLTSLSASVSVDKNCTSPQFVLYRCAVLCNQGSQISTYAYGSVRIERLPAPRCKQI